MLLKEVIEMGHFREAKGIGDFRNTPCAMAQKRFRFLHNAIGDKLCCCFLCRPLHCPVQMIDMHI